MLSPFTQADLLPLRVPSASSNGLTVWTNSQLKIGSAEIWFRSGSAELELSCVLTNEPGGRRVNVTHKISLRYIRLTFGLRPYMICKGCGRGVVVLILSRRHPFSTPSCRKCAGAKYVSRAHYGGHPITKRRRARRLIDRGSLLIERRGIRADRRARGFELLAEGEKLLAQHAQQTAARAASIAKDLESRLVDAKKSRMG